MFDSSFTSMASTSSLAAGEKKHWWLSNKRIVEKYIRDAKVLIASREQAEIASALTLLDAALVISPRFEQALELKAKSLLHLKRYKDVADMLQDYIPSFKMSADDTSSSSHSSDNSSTQMSREQVKLLYSGEDEPSFKCFSVSELKNKVLAGLSKSCEKEGQWRYLVLGQACCHLGLMEDAMVLLQTGKRLASAAFRRESICWSEDSFSFKQLPLCSDSSSSSTNSPPKTEAENISQLLAQIKLLLRRKTAAIAALDAGLYSEAIRHFSKIVDGRRGAPQTFLAQCYMYRALAYRSAGRIAEAIADSNKTLALDPSCIEALSTRAALFEAIRCFPDSLHDLEHLKLLYNSILRDRKLPGPAWKRQSVHYREIPGRLCSLASKMQELKKRVASGEKENVDYHALIGLKRGCSRSELERAHLLLTLRHKPDRSSSFIDRCEFPDDCDVASMKDRAKLSALSLYRLIQKGYTNVMSTIINEEAADKQRKKAAAAAAAATTAAAGLQSAQAIQVQQSVQQGNTATALQSAQSIQVQQGVQQHGKILEPRSMKLAVNEVISFDTRVVETKVDTNASVFQGVFCRDLAVVGNLLSQVGFNRPIPVKYEALSC